MKTIDFIQRKGAPFHTDAFCDEVAIGQITTRDGISIARVFKPNEAITCQTYERAKRWILEKTEGVEGKDD